MKKVILAAAVVLVALSPMQAQKRNEILAKAKDMTPEQFQKEQEVAQSRLEAVWYIITWGFRNL